MVIQRSCGKLGIESNYIKQEQELSGMQFIVTMNCIPDSTVKFLIYGKMSGKARLSVRVQGYEEIEVDG